MTNANDWNAAPLVPKYDMASTIMARMDEEIARRKLEWLDLCSRRNSFSPIFRLPAEILQAIFVYLAREWHAEYDGHVFSTVPRWVNVSYVCRRWRHVALDCSTLWSYLFVMSPRWTKELLERSKRASLKARANLEKSPGGWAVSFLQQVMTHADRVQGLSLRLSDHGYNLIDSYLLSYVPHLTNLSVSAESELSESELPAVLFGGDTPMLRTLGLSYCPVSWYSLKLGGLTSLVLRNIPRRFQQNTEDFLATLGCMPHLLILRLDYSLSSAADFLSSPAFKAFGKIDLPSLIHLRIAAPLSVIIAFLHCVEIPLKTAVELICDPEPNSSLADYSSLSSLLAQRFDTQAPSCPTVHSLLIGFCEEEVYLVFNSLEHNFFPDTEWDVNIPLRLDVYFDESIATDYGRSVWNNRDCFIADICCSMPLTSLRSLRVMYPSRSTTFWRRTLGHLQNLRRLELSDGRMPDLASVLSLSDHMETENRGRRLNWTCAPALEELQLRDVTFKRSGPVGGDMPRFADPQPLYDVLSGRKESRGLLTMVNCLVAQDHDVRFNMVGRWEDGSFRVIEESSQPYYDYWSDSETPDSASEGD